MPKSRNATSKWSGYSHQGKIGLLVALRKINALILSTQPLLGYRIEFETQEDAKIIENNTAIEVHQVKAYRASTTKGAYTKALKEFEICAGVNYLHTICEITNWSEITQQENPHSVLRYPYTITLNYCSQDSIYSYLDIELVNLLRIINHPERNNAEWRRTSFYSFLGLLDEKIRFEHQNGNENTYNVQFTFSELLQIITAPLSRFLEKIYSIREAMFLSYIRFIDDLDDNNLIMSDEHETYTCDKIKEIYTLSNEKLEQFLYNINPHTTNGQDLKRCVLTDKFYSEDAFYGTFLTVIFQIISCQYQLSDDLVPKYFLGKNYVLTSIQSAQNLKSKHARSILTNNKANFSAYETDFIITDTYTGRIGECANALVEKDPNKFFNPLSMEFIAKNDAIDKLNN